MPRGLLVAEKLRLGKLITKTTDMIETHHFNMRHKPFGTGGVWKAFKATGSGKFTGPTWVVKRYLENAKKDILGLGQSLEE